MVLAPRPRPARHTLPPHLAALLAAAPAVEPEFARPRAVRLLAPFRDLAVRVRIYNPRPPAADERAAQPAGMSFGARLSRAVDAIGRWLVRASPSRRVRACG